MRWTKEEKLKMVLEYKKNGFTPIVDGCSRATMRRRIRMWIKVYDIYGESGLEHRSRHWTNEDKINAVQRVLDGESCIKNIFRGRGQTLMHPLDTYIVNEISLLYL